MNPDSELAQSLVSDAPSAEMLDLMLISRQASARITLNPYLYDPKLQKRLYRVKAPTLIVRGEADQLIPLEHGRFYEREIKGARLSIIQGCGHLPPLEVADDTAGRVIEFLKS
jgi:pimeloyl-ACP methyl ester carboxylesterase